MNRTVGIIVFLAGLYLGLYALGTPGEQPAEAMLGGAFMTIGLIQIIHD